MNHTEDVFICLILNIYDEMIPFRQMTDILFARRVLIRLINVIYLKSIAIAKLVNLNFQTLEVVGRVANYSYLLDLRPNIYKFCCLNSQFIPDNSNLIS